MWWQWRDSNPQSPPWKGGVLLFSTTLPFMSERLPAQFSWIYHNLYHYIIFVYVSIKSTYFIGISPFKKIVDIIKEDTFCGFPALVQNVGFEPTRYNYCLCNLESGLADNRSNDLLPERLPFRHFCILGWRQELNLLSVKSSRTTLRDSVLCEPKTSPYLI